MDAGDGMAAQLLLCQNRFGIWLLLCWHQCSVAVAGYDDHVLLVEVPNRFGPLVF